MAILCPQSEGEPPRDPLAQRLYALLPTDCRLVVVHASLADLRPPSGQGLWEVIAALLALTERGITIAVPTFTFAFCKSGRFDRWRTPGEVGILGNALLSVDGCLRTADPIYSHAVIGPLADQLCDWIGETAWGEGSIYDAFIHHDAVAIMLGCSWEACTPVHRCELLARVPYRLDKTFSGTLRDADSERAIAVNMFVRDLHIDARNSWAPLERRLRERGCINGFAWWSGTIECCRLRALQEHGLALLAEDPWALVANANIARKRASSLQAPQLTVLIAAMGNADLLAEKFRETIAVLLPERRVVVHTVPFGQLHVLSNDPHWSLPEHLDLIIAPDRLEEVLGVSSLDGVATEAVSEAVSNHSQALLHLRRSTGAPMVVHRFADLDLPTRVLDDEGSIDGRRALIVLANEALDVTLADTDRLLRLDPAGTAARAGVAAADERLWLLGRIGCSDAFLRVLAHEHARALIAWSGHAVRLIVLDLDGTLWGGILGEDGVDGLSLGGDYPGNAFRSFQSTLKSLRSVGIALAICSKNDHKNAIAAMAAMPSMILGAEDFTAMRINWHEKWHNLAAIAESLSLSLAHVLFIDDNPVEREAIRRNLPSVQVLDLPVDPSGYRRALLMHPRLALTPVTSTDRQRAEAYRTRAQALAIGNLHADRSSFIRSLQITVTVMPLSAANRVRALQLLQKTNQFNVTSHRHGERELDNFVHAGHTVVVVRVADRFNAAEDMGLMILCHDLGEATSEIETYLLSCRVLGKGVEQALVAWAAVWCRDLGMQQLRGQIIPTERNTPARGIYAECGFTNEFTNWWRLRLDASCTLDSRIQIVMHGLQTPASRTKS